MQCGFNVFFACGFNVDLMCSLFVLLAFIGSSLVLAYWVQVLIGLMLFDVIYIYIYTCTRVCISNCLAAQRCSREFEHPVSLLCVFMCVVGLYSLCYVGLLCCTADVYKLV